MLRYEDGREERGGEKGIKIRKGKEINKRDYINNIQEIMQDVNTSIL